MTKKAEKAYWFRAKKYGWGWGLPLTWQGWLSFGVFLLVWLLALSTLIVSAPDTEPISTQNIALFFGIMFIDVALLVYVSFKYGEKPKWKWGKKHGRTKKS